MNDYEKYLFHLHCNGDLFAEQWIPFTYEQWVKNGKPENDGAVNIEDGKIYLKTFNKYEKNRSIF